MDNLQDLRFDALATLNKSPMSSTRLFFMVAGSVVGYWVALFMLGTILVPLQNPVVNVFLFLLSIVAIFAPLIGIIVFVILYSTTNEDKLRQKAFANFCAANGFSYLGNSVLPPTQLLAMTNFITGNWHQTISGVYQGYGFVCGISDIMYRTDQAIKVQNILLTVRLQKVYPHVVADSLQRQGWNRGVLHLISGASQLFTDAGTEVSNASYLQQLVQRITGILPADVELQGNLLYIVAGDNVRPDASTVQKIFQLINAVNTFEQQ